MVEHQSKSLNS